MHSIIGTHLNYYFHCHRQLWLFGHNIQMEQENVNVQIGKLVSDESYSREKHEWAFTHQAGPLENVFANIKVDFIDYRTGIVHEIKKSQSFEEAHEWQVLFYLLTLKEMGVVKPDGTPFEAELDYPLQKRKFYVYLTPVKEKQLCEIIQRVLQILSQEIIPMRLTNRKICRSCSYYELCYS